MDLWTFYFNFMASSVRCNIYQKKYLCLFYWSGLQLSWYLSLTLLSLLQRPSRVNKGVGGFYSLPLKECSWTLYIINYILNGFLIHYHIWVEEFQSTSNTCDKMDKKRRQYKWVLFIVQVCTWTFVDFDV